jgi:hypothetical protein
MDTEKIKKVNETLKAGEASGNYTADHKGYKGYKPQAVIDAVNQEFLGKWSLEIKEKSFIDSLASHPILDDVGDAFKSAQTDAMKKAFAHFSIGNRAYWGLLK